MANSFTFPPPPPPPPATSAFRTPSAGHTSQNPQQPHRGRGGFNSGSLRGGRGGNSRAGYGDHKGHGSGPRSGYSYTQRNGFQQSTNQSNSRHFTQSKPYPPPPIAVQASTNGHHHTGNRDYQHKLTDQSAAKRSYEQAFQNKSTIPKLQAAPAVPSFGFALPCPTPQKKPESPKTASAAPQKRKLLGLIPLEDEGDASDEDEEAKLAAAHASSGAALSFLYKGKLATLRTPDEIAAWIAERRKNYPTVARGEIMAKQKAEERAKAGEKKEAMRKKMLETKMLKTKKKEQPKFDQRATPPKAKKDTRGVEPPSSKEQLKMERLRRTIAKNAKQLAKLEAASKSGQGTVSRSAGSNTLANKESHDDTLDDFTTSDSDITSDDETSSSDLSDSEDSDTSSDSDSDLDEGDANGAKQTIIDALKDATSENSSSESDAPQELSSTQLEPSDKTPALRGRREDKRPLCRNVKLKGKCRKRGCKFRHKVKEGEITTQTEILAKKPIPRMSLYQRLLKQQIEEDEQTQEGIRPDNGTSITV